MQPTYTKPDQLLRYKTLREILAGKPPGLYDMEDVLGLR